MDRVPSMPLDRVPFVSLTRSPVRPPLLVHRRDAWTDRCPLGFFHCTWAHVGGRRGGVARQVGGGGGAIARRVLIEEEIGSDLDGAGLMADADVAEEEECADDDEI
eukprot:scaffold28143_cov152-Isochrysis_galbana.AAC.2